MVENGAPLLEEIRQTRPFRSPAEEAYLGLLRTADLLRRRISDEIAAMGITHQQYNVLRILAGTHPESLPTLEVADRMIEQAPGITRLLDRLVDKGLVDRKRCETDRRQMHCRITPAGLDLLDRLQHPVLNAVETVFRCIGPARVAQLTELLDELRAGDRPDADS